jgi:import receptor subunit TOM70
MSEGLTKNWKAVALVAAAIAAATYYVCASPKPLPTENSSATLKKKKQKKKPTKKKNVEAPEQEAVEIKVSDNEALAQEEKAMGNKVFAEKKYDLAVEHYTRAIELFPNAIFYCNRAAAFLNLEKYDLSIKDCAEAISLDPKYIKAFHRRACAYEKSEDHQSALHDYLTVCALEKFSNPNSMQPVDRMITSIASKKTKETLESKNNTVSFPSETFLRAYLDSFRARPSDADIVLGLELTEESDLLLQKSFSAYKSRKWEESYDYCEKAIELDKFSSNLIKSKALNYKATFFFLMARNEEAVNYLETSLKLDPTNVNTIIKRATLYMEKGDVENTLKQFELALELSRSNPDIYYHRGQVRFLTGDFQGAVDDYTASLENEKPEETSVYAHIQLGVAKYKLGDVVGSEKKFREAKKLYPDSAEVWHYHGEILMDMQKIEEGFFKIT